MVRLSDTYQKLLPHIIYLCIDIHCEVPVVPFKQLSQMQPGESSEKIRERVIKARRIQEERYKGAKGVYCNA